MLDRIVHAANHDVPVGQEDVVVVKRRETAADRRRMARGLLNRLVADYYEDGAQKPDEGDSKPEAASRKSESKGRKKSRG